MKGDSFKSISPMLTKEKFRPHVHHITKRRNGSIIFLGFSILRNTWDGKFSYCHIFSFVATENFWYYDFFVELQPCWKEMVTKMYVLRIHYINLELRWKYEEYDLLLPESIVEYVINHLKRIKRKSMNQNIEWIQFLWTYVIKHFNVKLRFPLNDPTKWYQLQF